jgi:hypothetical protein
MDARLNFERNLLALAATDPQLCKRLSAAVTTKERYRILPARNGSLIPAAVDGNGAARPLHSLVDPEKEAQRLMSTIRGGGFLILFGLGGGFAASAALAREDVQGLLIVDFDVDGIAELLASKDYFALFADPRCRILIDPSPTELRETILAMYRPAFSGGISVLPLRARVETAEIAFAAATDAVRDIIDSISDDYSVQAYFGKRWFGNILRNLRAADGPVQPSPRVRTVAVTAAGPSLDEQLSALKERRGNVFLLATDTSLPALLAAGLKPDAVISIDCQHISYYHFMDGLPQDIPLFLDLASPPVVASRSRNLRFFSGGHPLTVYISRAWRSFPRVDTSGGNVTYAAVALADKLGAELIELYGADFSYPNGEPYARGTYIHPYFRRVQHRLQPLEGLFASFVFRNESLIKETDTHGWRYETKPLVGYRLKLEHLAEQIDARIEPATGRGAPILIPVSKGRRTGPIPLMGPGQARSNVRNFLDEYRTAIERLPELTTSICEYFENLSDEARDVFTTLLPAAAAIRKKDNSMEPAQLVKAVKAFSLAELDRIR